MTLQQAEKVYTLLSDKIKSGTIKQDERMIYNLAEAIINRDYMIEKHCESDNYNYKLQNKINQISVRIDTLKKSCSIYNSYLLNEKFK